MKKIIIAAAIVFSALSAQAQEVSQTLGLRLGDNDGLGYEISYQKPTGDNRLQLDLGLRSSDNSDAYKLTGTYQWVKDLSSLADGFQWFYGAGAGIGHVSIDVPGVDGETFVNAAGTVGIEYKFDFPLQLSLDARPEIGILNGDSDLGLDLALGVRYVF
ncbi:hypothetical protein N9901_01720 [Flavobacteriaceae bacterium]|nr:hypothetical protein [Flavobacteriaceae bacterium]